MLKSIVSIKTLFNKEEETIPISVSILTVIKTTIGVGILGLPNV